MEQQKISKRKQKIGVVMSNKMAKTVSVRVERSMRHPQFEKVIIRSKKHYAHVEDLKLQPGQKVLIEETRPLSKLKRWRVIKVVA